MKHYSITLVAKPYGSGRSLRELGRLLDTCRPSDETIADYIRGAKDSGHPTDMEAFLGGLTLGLQETLTNLMLEAGWPVGGSWANFSVCIKEL